MGRVAEHARRPAPRAAASGSVRHAPVVEPRGQRILDLQRDAGNAAVVQLLAGGEEAEDPKAVETARAIFDQGARSYEAGAYARAYDEFTRAWELCNRPGLLFSRAQALRRLGGRREEAIALYREYLGTGETRRAEEATAFIKELETPASTGDLELDTKAGKDIFEKGARLYEARDYAHAYDEFTRSWELTHRPGLLFSRAQALRRLGGRREEAMSLYREYLASGDAKRTADAQAALAELQTPASTGDLEADTNAGKGLFDKGAAYYDARDYAHAYDEFTRSWELTERPGLLFSRAQALRRLGGRREEAIALYEAYLEKGDGKRTADAQAALAELQTPSP